MLGTIASGLWRRFSVHLSLAAMFGVALFAAWAQSVDIATTTHRVRFPALRPEECVSPRRSAQLVPQPQASIDERER